jgi:hypothetical protein
MVMTIERKAMATAMAWVKWGREEDSMKGKGGERGLHY